MKSKIFSYLFVRFEVKILSSILFSILVQAIIVKMR